VGGRLQQSDSTAEKAKLKTINEREVFCAQQQIDNEG
jgi:hypothetical protein